MSLQTVRCQFHHHGNKRCFFLLRKGMKMQEKNQKRCRIDLHLTKNG